MNGYNLIWLPYLAGCISFRVQNGVCLFNCAENYSTLQLKEHAKKPNHFTCTSITIKIFPFIHESRQKKFETVQFFFLCVTEQQTISKSTFHYQYDSWHEYTATTACVEKSIQYFCDWCWLFFFVASYNNNNKIEIERYSEWFCVHKIIIGFEWNFEM